MGIEFHDLILATLAGLAGAYLGSLRRFAFLGKPLRFAFAGIALALVIYVAYFFIQQGDGTGAFILAGLVLAFPVVLLMAKAITERNGND